MYMYMYIMYIVYTCIYNDELPCLSQVIRAGLEKGPVEGYEAEAQVYTCWIYAYVHVLYTLYVH